jgi:Ca-activated chloride channel family protein
VAPVLAVLAAAFPLIAQDQAPSFKGGVDVVEVYASVTDRDGRPIEGLTRDQFTVTEDDAPQAISTFAASRVPLSVALAIDRSWSMAGQPLGRTKRAAAIFLDALAPPDEAMVIAVSGRVETVAPLGADFAQAKRAVERLDPWSTTALHDAILEAVDVVQAGTGRRALVLVSDGVDRYSRASADDVTAHVRQRDVMIYSVALAKAPPPLFVELAALTGGRPFHARDAAALETAMRAIADDLHHQYLLGYTPSPRDPRASAGTWRSIRVTTTVPGAQVRARRGYVVR